MKYSIGIIFVFFLSHFVFSKTLTVGYGQKIVRIQKGIATCNAGDTLIIKSGVYREGNILVDKPLYILGENYPILDGVFKDEVISVKSAYVTIDGLHIKNSRQKTLDDPAGIKLYESNYVNIINNKFTDNFFAVYLQYSSHCLVKNNTIVAHAIGETSSGNGIHCWYSDSLLIIANTITGHRDGIYLEFVTGSLVWRNISQDNVRYGLHFMFSHSDSYITNVFKNNGAGVAVMFSKNVKMVNNKFEQNWGDASYGLLLKEISDCYLAGNKFFKNTTAVLMDGTNRIEAENNVFQNNGWALRLQSNCTGNVLRYNNFLGNTFDISTSGSLVSNTFDSNYWDKYEGYDLNKDNIGDIPYHPLSMYSIIVQKIPSAMLLFRSFIVSLLDKSEKVMPSLTPDNFVDLNPLMHSLKL
ncbi:nitrous oxide reductase family maturation protein NosD [uncultured Cytophaga sp.]|uniref:nitrous oxide reductase family maturation protein NosD n=1 Tax=uncultured Cytophaga sp. TaxID=160238 RepID=UPI0026114216|nr:nitrous oxide reductase family maturation protein NosD [uncultured Cytophaga sp.]